MHQMTMFDEEVPGFKSHWRSMGLVYHYCVNCGFIETSAEWSEYCPKCKSIMIMPPPKKGEEK